MEMDYNLKNLGLTSQLLFPRVFKKIDINSWVSISFRIFKFIFLLMFKDDVFHGLSCLPIISEQFRPKIRKITVT